MSKKIALLSSGAALLWSLFLFDVCHAVQTEKKQEIRYLTLAEIKATANAPTTRISNTPFPCTEDEMRISELSCQKQSLLGSRGKTLDNILYTIAAVTVTLVMTLVALVLWVVMSRRIPLRPFIKGSH